MAYAALTGLELLSHLTQAAARLTLALTWAITYRHFVA